MSGPLDDADRAMQTFNDAELGPVEPEVQEQIPQVAIVACLNLAIEYERCVTDSGPLLTYQKLKALMRRAEGLLPGGTY